MSEDNYAIISDYWASGKVIKELKEENKHLNLQLDQALKDYEELLIKIDKAIEYLKQPYRDNFDYSQAELLEILGDKENENNNI